MHPLLEGMILGLTLAVMLGPAMFTLIQTSIHRGLYRGIVLATGIFLSDLVIVVFCYLGAAQIFGSDRNGLLFGIVGGIILIVFGIVTYLRKVHLSADDMIESYKMPGPLTYILKGFFLNFANPFIWLFWISVMVTVSASNGSETSAIKLFFTGALVTTFSTDLLKVFIANKLKGYLKPRTLIKLNHAVGIMLVIFGVFLMIRTFIQF
ncbi:MAG: LysE family transporter [Lentimicrobiaceae bacterium]